MMRFLTLAFAALLCSSPACAAATPDDCWTLQRHGQHAQADACFTQLTRSSDAAARAEGFWGLEDWQAANDSFRAAAGGGSAAVKVRWGTLFHERFNNPEAVNLFREALAQDPNSATAYLGLATVSAEEYDGKANEYIARAEALDPKLAAAHELAARIALENDNRDLAATEADKALALSSDATEAIAIHASLDLIADRPADAWFAKLAAINPHDGEAYQQVAHHLELHYRFTDAAAYDRKAVEADPRLWSAHAALGLALMRLGQEDEPAKQLEMAYNNGYRNPATVNSLRLLDSYKNFDTTREPATVIKLDKRENELLAPYVQNELQTILATYSKKYGSTLR